jgi:cytochrome c nitrite reductase small subunit
MRRRSILIIVATVAVLLVVAIGLGFHYTSQPSFCSSCHPIVPFKTSWDHSSHEAAGVTCIQCHFEPGLVGYLKGKVYSAIKLTQWAFGQSTKKPEASRAIVSGACRQCHPNPTSTFIPHTFHTDVANLECTECHSGVVHGALVGADKPQAKADPAFCNRCHTGDIAPILFGPIPPAGREHPGVPKIDVNEWRNIHWRMADGPAVINGIPYDKIQRETCLVCHQDPTQARACKGCHFGRVPDFRISTSAQHASGFPLGLGSVVFALLLLAGFLVGRRKVRLFASRWMLVLVGLVVASDVVVTYFLVRDTLGRRTGSVEIGPTTVWITYLLLSIALALLVLYEAVIRPQPDSTVALPHTPEEDMCVPDYHAWHGETAEVDQPAEGVPGETQGPSGAPPAGEADHD